MQKSWSAALWASSALIALVTTPALGQDADDEIVVTASKRGATDASDIPQTIQAIGEDDLRSLGAFDFADFAPTVAGLNFEDLGPGDKEYILRGVNSSGDATVGVYYDEAVITGRFEQDGGGRNADIKLYDIQQVEVLKGPQGTLYGANSMTGTIRFITNKPQLDEMSGWLEAGASNVSGGEGGYNFAGMFNAPLVEGVAGLRAVAWYQKDGGFVDNPRLGIKDINDEETYGGRLHFAVEPTDNLKFLATGTYQSVESGGSNRFTPEGVLGAGVPGEPGLEPILGGDYVNTEFTRNPWDEELYILSGLAEWTTDFGVVTATTNLYDREIDFAFDSSPILFFFGVNAAALTQQPQDRELWTSELRFASTLDGPVNFVVGGFLSREEANFASLVIATDADGRALAPFAAGPANDFFAGGATFFGRTLLDRRDQEAIFGEVTVDLMDSLSVTGGLRYFSASIDSKAQVIHDFVTGDELAPLELKGDEDGVTYRANASYKPTDDITLYFETATGFRQGGVNSPGFTGVVIPPTFESDNVTSYEVGAKTSFADGRAKLEIAGYRMNWSEIQNQDFNSGFSFFTNAGRARILGLEAVGSIEPTDNLEFVASATITNAELKEDQPSSPGASGRSGDPIPNVPDFSAYLGAIYSFDLNADWGGEFRIDYTHRGKFDIDFNPLLLDGSPNDNFATAPSSDLVNLSLSLRNEGLDIRLYARNIANDVELSDIFINGAQDPVSHIAVPPRSYGVLVRKSF